MFRAGQEIGVYTLVSRIGRGGFGEVWLAERRTKFAATQVAVKLPHDEQVDQDAIKQEAQVWARASGHANVLPIIEANDYDGQIVIVSEYAPDGSLEALLKKSGGLLPQKQAVEIAIGILNGLDFLHSRQIIHRDLKPANVLLQGDTPRLADFGISRAMQTTSMSVNVAGTPVYMSPEAFDGKRNKLTDIWSVGIILYQMLSGAVPFSQNSQGELLAAIIMREPAPLPDSFPAQLRQIVKKALMKQPAERYQTAAEMRNDLVDFLAKLSQRQAAVAPKSEEFVFAHNANKISVPTSEPVESNTLTSVQPVSSPVTVKSLKPNRNYYAIPAALALMLLAFGGYFYLLSGKQATVTNDSPTTTNAHESSPTATHGANSTPAEQSVANSNVSISANTSLSNVNSSTGSVEKSVENSTSSANTVTAVNTPSGNNPTGKSNPRSPEITAGDSQISKNPRESDKGSSRVTTRRPINERRRANIDPTTDRDRNSDANPREDTRGKTGQAIGDIIKAITNSGSGAALNSNRPRP